MRRAVAVLLVSVLAAATMAIASGVASAASGGRLDEVLVDGAFGQKPTITVPEAFSVRSSVSDVRVEGSGVKASKGSRVLVDYVILNARNGQEIETSYGSDPATLQLGKGSTKAVVNGLVGHTPGSRVVVAVAPEDGLTKKGGSVGVKKNDTLLFVIDVRDVKASRAAGTAVTPPAGLPAVTLDAKGVPTIDIPKGDPPSDLVVQPLIKGGGPAVQPGQQLTVQYTGVLWRSGKPFDSSWSRGEPATFPVGAGQLIAGWDEGLVGQTVGSQVLLVVPPDKGYGKEGQPSAGIKGTDTLVFVVDILEAT